MKYWGIIIVVLGAYLLNVSELKNGIFLPFKKLFTNKGVLFFLLANLIWAITPIFQKQAISQTNPLFTSLIENIIIVIFFIPIVLVKARNKFPQIKRAWRMFFVIGPIGAFSTWAAFTAFSLAPLGPVTSVFKFSSLFTIR